VERGGVARINSRMNPKYDFRWMTIHPVQVYLHGHETVGPPRRRVCIGPLSEFVLRHKLLVVLFWVAVFAVVAPVVDVRITRRSVQSLHRRNERSRPCRNHRSRSRSSWRMRGY
jgi:hypothetical protein